MTYEILDDGNAILCFRCGQTSHSLGDTVHLFCPDCGYHPAMFEQMHPDAQEMLRLIARGTTHLSRIPLFKDSDPYTFRLLEGLQQRGFVELDAVRSTVALTEAGRRALGGGGIVH